MANKLPALQFYIGDWKKDAELSMCSISTRDFWIELLGVMDEHAKRKTRAERLERFVAGVKF